MTRCDYDGVFYRVFCVTLLAIAFAFTVILTNVFVDIDGLLTTKKAEKAHSNHATQNDVDAMIQPDSKSEPYYNEDTSYDDTEYGYRVRRSLESQNYMFRMKNPKLKNILKNRLATLLEDLDAETSSNQIKSDQTDKTLDKAESNDEMNFYGDKHEKKGDKQTNDNRNEQFKTKEPHDNLLHLVTHNIILRGIVDHVDLHEVFNKVQAVVTNNKGTFDVKVRDPKAPISQMNEAIDPVPLKTTNPLREETLIYDEVMNCKKLRKQIKDAEMEIAPDRGVTRKGPKLLIKTVIDIRSQSDDKSKKENNTDSIKGVVKLIYNGKSIKFSRMDDEVTTAHTSPVSSTVTTPTTPTVTTEISTTTDAESDALEDKYSHLPKGFLNKILNNYFADKKTSVLHENVDKKRSKRQIKIRYETDDAMHVKHLNHTKKDDDELYVEIETHFDSKGMKGEKKKKLINKLIEKIQKAIHDPTNSKKKAKSHKTVHVKKRTQNRLDHKEFHTKTIAPVESLLHRQLDPISKVAAPHNPITTMFDKTGEGWKKKFTGPGFLTHTKGLNSAEMGEVEVNYAKTVNNINNGIPQRYQKPLNVQPSDEVNQANNLYDLGNLKFFLKDIDGTGFSIGINQFVDEPPDAESIKLFTGLENIIQTYHQNYDPNDLTSVVGAMPERSDYPNYNESMEHFIIRRSVNEKDYHSNEYKTILNNDFQEYQNYEDIINNNKDIKENTAEGGKIIVKRGNQPPLTLDDNILSKDLNPAEIFRLANLLARRKRSITVKKISNLRKIKLNRFINTKPMARKLFFTRNRNKRQINKIRIIASDMPNANKQSEEIFVVSDEHLFADRAIVREMDTPEARYAERDTNHNDKVEEHYDIINPYAYEDNTPYTYVSNMFDGKARHNSLMSKYPHIFLEEVTRSKEEEEPRISLVSHVSQRHHAIQDEHPATSSPFAEDQAMPRLDEIVNAISPDQAKTNYKVTVKILPKNGTDMHSGFKEIHTSINKSFNKNGLLYSSLVNVSEISKVTKMNKTNIHSIGAASTPSPVMRKLKEEQERIHELLKRHKDRIDEQLLHLNMEKVKLETLIDNKKTQVHGSHSNEYVDVAVPPDPAKIVRVRKNEADTLTASGFKDQSTSAPTTVLTTPYTMSTTPQPVTSTQTTTVTTTKPIVKECLKEADKIAIISTIERNGNITYEILNKIDKNTQILEKFLRKVSEQSQPIVPTTRRTIAPEESNIALNIPKNWKKFQPIHDSFLNEPNSEAHKNDSRVTLPFIYAYQQTYHLPEPNGKAPVAGVVYHGHMHANKKADYWNGQVKTNEIEKPNADGAKVDGNQSRFFLDGPDNEFKEIPMDSKKKSKPFPAPKDSKVTNTTIPLKG